MFNIRPFKRSWGGDATAAPRRRLAWFTLNLMSCKPAAGVKIAGEPPALLVVAAEQKRANNEAKKFK